MNRRKLYYLITKWKKKHHPICYHKIFTRPTSCQHKLSHFLRIVTDFTEVLSLKEDDWRRRAIIPLTIIFPSSLLMDVLARNILSAKFSTNADGFFSYQYAQVIVFIIFSYQVIAPMFPWCLILWILILNRSLKMKLFSRLDILKPTHWWHSGVLNIYTIFRYYIVI